MLINELAPVTKDRSKIFLDNGESFVLYKGELRKLKLKAGQELKEELYNEITKVILPKRAKLRMMNLLKERDYTEYQLSKKLLDADYPKAIVEEALNYVKSFNYVDDLRYATDYIKQESARRSKKEIYLKLSQKGIKKETLDKAFSDLYGEFSEARQTDTFNETDVIIKALRKKKFTGEESYEEKQKLLAYFYRRGFDVDKVYKAMDRIKEENIDE